MYHLDDNIVAIASARGGGARGIIRASGATVVAQLGPHFHCEPAVDFQRLARPARVSAQLRLPEFTEPLPGSLYLWPTRRSYTGEPLLEWHTLGSPPILEAALHAFCTAGVRLAEPGEFTLRAFLAGRLDLTQAEAVLGVIDAHSNDELHTALGQLAGGLTQPLAKVRAALLDLLVDLEAGLDFVEEDISFVAQDEILRRLTLARQQVTEIAEQMSARRESNDLPLVVLRGWPNTGKSSLFNVLSGAPTAIVSKTAGTTRDYLQTSLRLGEFECRLIDTAGVMLEAGDSIDQAAQVAAHRQVEQSALELYCLDSTRQLEPGEIALLAAPARGARIIVWTKSDLPGSQESFTQFDEIRRISPPCGELHTSSRTGAGLAELRQMMATTLQDVPESTSVVMATAERSREAVSRASSALANAMAAAAQKLGEELVAAEIRAALEELGAVAGAVYTDELLDGIFSRFCIGK